MNKNPDPRVSTLNKIIKFLDNYPTDKVPMYRIAIKCGISHYSTLAGLKFFKKLGLVEFNEKERHRVVEILYRG